MVNTALCKGFARAHAVTLVMNPDEAVGVLSKRSQAHPTPQERQLAHLEMGAIAAVSLAKDFAPLKRQSTNIKEAMQRDPPVEARREQDRVSIEFWLLGRVPTSAASFTQHSLALLSAPPAPLVVWDSHLYFSNNKQYGQLSQCAGYFIYSSYFQPFANVSHLFFPRLRRARG